MINDKKILAIIPARGGSKGVLRKNLRSVAGKPLIAWSIEEAKKSKYIDHLILSTEDTEIITTAEEYGCDVPFVRPIHLAEDDTPGIAPVLHALEHMPAFDYVMLLQPTSPLRSVLDIDLCIERCEENNAVSSVSVNISGKSPFWMYTLDHNKMKPVINQVEISSRRQNLPDVYELNGAIYIAQTEWLIENRTFLHDETLPFVIPKERSYDIDTEEDLLICDLILRHRGIQ
ncbi:CMP-N,N'-diacetyllegionaminic acid synthase [Paenibacillus sp. 4624]|jgi:N-acylneuraminate cytidylyltransferase|uniref:Acylneuraminate cytidylyltransferase family protein n=1 Tax=Paenibacillus amylolyticus TaxID=1451 RepID=A0A5M9WVI1_PAEAM|nr:acylneuraminate cytidylyltransferase family protein [Paenibacillus amylolyticus]KAA8785585.1 acylneuraminate cytidylyltransferase family protein [Paenibacillus amylolyticus]